PHLLTTTPPHHHTLSPPHLLTTTPPHHHTSSPLKKDKFLFYLHTCDLNHKKHLQEGGNFGLK
ncbi:hypothetical protein, partial [Myroides odoratus]|uniref:hypothetical protein n=1 Tax=Myroides odoratus TaxID=256 RepID=UPI001E5C42AF